MLNSSLSYASWFHSFTYKQFHILLNSLFKVLCNFPSRYLFAIGLALIFSFRWSLPPTLGCTLKQPDSSMPKFAHQLCRTTAMGLAPAMVYSPCQRDLRCWVDAMHLDIHAASLVN